MKNRLILFVLFVLFSIKVQSQNNVSASLGVGLPELINIGARYELPPIKFGMSIGTAFTGDYALSGDVYYHFGGRSQLSEVPPWYIRANLTWWQFNKILFIDLGEAVLLGIRVGRDFNVTENFGVSIDGGIIPVSFFSGKKIPFSFIPTVSFSVYNRLWKLHERR